MIAYLEGTILRKEADGIILLAGHIGYEILLDNITLSMCMEKSRVNEIIALYIYYHVTERQPKPVLIGFLTPEDKEFFQLFITVAAIGPMKAIKALTRPVPQVARAIEDRDTAFLSQLTGIGKRTAEKIVATLNGKVLAFAATKKSEPDAAPTEPTDALPEENQIMVRQVTEVLTEQLGHSASSAKRMIRQALEKNPTISSPEDLFDEIYQETR
ncbi:Holliday junction branch migration protein RuvA [uncultured Desulfobacter sp.]|uniref:Holliday junction branch migration protein RuvA n=1 Tax=uncultured Desulfobacter sp. TaxID=240139 RepID=UPI0029F4B0E6|nr:Holliday junction branch migration protein RuvA [uncultured Desulfobacter sp.]